MIPIRKWAELYNRPMREAVRLYRDGKAPAAVGAVSRWLYLDQWAKWNGISLETARKLYEEDRTPRGVYMCGTEVGPQLWYKSDKAWGDIIMEMQRQIVDLRVLFQRFNVKRTKWKLYLRDARRLMRKVVNEQSRLSASFGVLRRRTSALNRTLQLALIAHQRGDLFLSRTEGHRLMQKREVEKAKDRHRLGVEDYRDHLDIRKAGVAKVDKYRERHGRRWR